MDVERIMGAFEWRLGLLPENADAGRDWQRVEKWLRADSRRLEAVALKMAEPLIEIILWGLLARDGDTDPKDLSPSRWAGLKSYLQDHTGILGNMATRAASYIGDSAGTFDLQSVAVNRSFPAVTTDSGAEEFGNRIDSRKFELSAGQSSDSGATAKDEEVGWPRMKESPPVESTMAKTPDIPESSSGDEVTQPQNGNSPDSSPADNVRPETPAQDSTQPPSAAEDTAQPPDSSSPSLSSQWRYLDVPEGPDKHDEFDERSAEVGEFKLIGARVRGKKHKHEGTNCDDWFEFRNSGAWTIIAVSDGAGSKVFSRIGAKESCQTTVEELSLALADHSLKQRESWSNETFKRDKQSGVFAEDDLEYVQQALHDAMQKAYERVEAKAKELGDSSEHEAILGRKVVMDDLSGTLLLAVHTTVTHNGGERSFVLTCQIGDGMLAALSTNGGLQLLGIPDSGEFAGQTEFLTSKKKMEKSNLTSKTFPFFGPMQALMVMTDGVADDYFPNDPGMLRLYGDLAINGVLHFSVDAKKQRKLIDSSLAETNLKNTAAVANAGLATAVEAITPAGPRQVMIRSVETYADKLGLPLEEVVKSTPLLMAGTIGNPGEEMCTEKESEQMLRVWLDSYHVRGSFDDRTLVVLYREVAS